MRLQISHTCNNFAIILHCHPNFVLNYIACNNVFRYKEFREYCEDVPCVLVANKIDVDYNVTRKEFKFAAKHNLPFFFVSAADGTNVVKVFQSAILEAKRFKESGGDFLSNLLETLEGGEVICSQRLCSFL